MSVLYIAFWRGYCKYIRIRLEWVFNILVVHRESGMDLDVIVNDHRLVFQVVHQKHEW